MKTVVYYQVGEMLKGTSFESRHNFNSLEKAKAFAYENEDFKCEIRRVTETIEVIEIAEPKKAVKEEPKEEPKKAVKVKAQKKVTSDADIKKAWNQMKKDLKKEFPQESLLHYGFTMNARQIKNRTATFVAGRAQEYSDQIAGYEKRLAEILGSDSWSEYQKEVDREWFGGRIAGVRELQAQFGTAENQVKVLREMIENSKAFAKFQNTIGKTITSVEETSDGMYNIRFNY